MKKNLIYIIFFLTFISCRTEVSIPKETTDYLTEVLDLLEEKSVNKNKIDWNKFRIAIFKKGKDAKNVADVYPAIEYAISELKDNHSYFKSVIESEVNTENKPLPVNHDETTPDDIGYIKIPFCIGTEDDYNDYILEITEKIKEQSKKKLKGWVIDLRGNFGGNMWPMLLSIEPLIGNGTFGYFVNSNNQYQAWKLNKGKVYIDDELIFEKSSYNELDLTNQFLAILTDSRTASSGEAITIALKNRVNSKSFGKPTYGVSTGCVSHQLSDGSTINLAESIFADRTKKKYGFKVIPDFETNEYDTLEKGIQWIYKMNN